ncbi:DUF3644 domain-containing protein [Maribacter chungangensis]|uniref:DUF3644 domain-containing protein n=1 Tax=Maribacter chungangensis TaxID=1069117 RepID=A0ABW3AZS5_9FLAO
MKSANEKQKKTLAFLQKKEGANKTFTAEELSEASTYPLKASLLAKLSRNEFGDFIVRVKDNTYKAQHTLPLKPNEYANMTSSRFRHEHPSSHSTNTIEKKESERIVDKSVQAALASIEIYNKPNFKYREETFSVLLVNAWELLMKARILSTNFEDIHSLYIENSKSTSGFEESRAGIPKTISINKAIKILSLDTTLTSNLYALIEIRDNAVHFKNNSHLLHMKVLEIGVASLQSYVEMIKEWFKYDLSRYNFYIMPMSFYHSFEMKSFSINSDSEQNQMLLKYISKVEKEHDSEYPGRHNISLILETELVKSKMRFDPENDKAIPVKLTDEDFRKKYPWNNKDHLIPKLQERYSNFSENTSFHKLKKEMWEKTNFSGTRRSDEDKPHTEKRFYSTNVFKWFDDYYTKK